PTTTEPSDLAESSSLYAKLGLTKSETDSDEEVSPEINAEVQEEGQAGPNPDDQDEGQAGSNPGDAAVDQPQSSHVVHENLKLLTNDQVILKEPATSTKTMSSLKHIDKEISFINQFLEEKSQEDEPDKTNTESEVQSMVTVPIHQDTSFVPLMTSPIIDLTVSQPASSMIHAPIQTSTTTTIATTTTSLPPPPPQPQQSTADLIIINRIGELERRRFSDLSAVDMKLALHQRMYEDESYETHKDHKNLFDALQKSLERDHSDQLASNLKEARLKKRKKCVTPRTPSGSPPTMKSTSSVMGHYHVFWKHWITKLKNTRLRDSIRE
ncbi:hypothetical protein Tco_0043244, partial [Tanacetum coccineum]